MAGLLLLAVAMATTMDNNGSCYPSGGALILFPSGSSDPTQLRFLDEKPPDAIEIEFCVVCWAKGGSAIAESSRPKQ